MSKALPVVRERANAPPRAVIDFDEKLAAHGLELRAAAVDTLQVNVGKLCNQACKHCHVDASPARTEIMARETVEQTLQAYGGVLAEHQPPAAWLVGPAQVHHLHQHLEGAAMALRLTYDVSLQSTPPDVPLPLTVAERLRHLRQLVGNALHDL